MKVRPTPPNGDGTDDGRSLPEHSGGTESVRGTNDVALDYHSSGEDIKVILTTLKPKPR